MDTNKNYYAVLGVLPTAEDAVIRAAYKALAQRYHPDRNGSESAKSRMQEINEAYSVLSDPEARAKYDSARSASKGADYEEFEDYAEASEKADSQLDEHWQLALEYYPEIDQCWKRLSKVSSRLAYTYQAYLIEEKAFKQAKQIADLMSDQFLTLYFGESHEIKRFAMELILHRKKEAARELNRAVKILGSDIDPHRVIRKIISEFHLDEGFDITMMARNHEERKKIIREREQGSSITRRGWMMGILALVIVLYGFAFIFIWSGGI